MRFEVPCCLCTQIYQKTTLWSGAEASEVCISGIGTAKGKENPREPHDARDHIHICIFILPKHPVAQVVGYIKGKAAISVAYQFGARKRNLNRESLWARS